MYYKYLLSLSAMVAVVITDAQSVCDTIGPNCNVVTNIGFQNLQSVQFSYPNIGPTIVDGDTYDAVIQWVPEDGHSLIHSFEIYKLDNNAPFNCTNIYLWNNGLKAGATAYTRGPSNDQDYCIFDITEVFPRSDLLNPDEVYFLFDGLTDSGTQLILDRKLDYQVVASEDTKYYLYDLDTTTLDTSSSHAEITLTVANITYSDSDFDGIGVCNSMETLLSTIDVGTCTLSLVSSDSDGGVFTYQLLKTQYDACANGITQEGNNIVYNFVISLPTDVGSCYYFKENDSTQEINVQIDVSNIVGDVNVTNIDDVSFQIIDYGLERCDPLSIVVPHFKSIFAINFTFVGDLMTMDGTNDRYLDTVTNLVTVVNSTCTHYIETDSHECIYYFISTECRPMYTTVDDTCVTDRFNDNVLNNVDISITKNAVETIHRFPVINTVLETVEFDISYCQVPPNINAVNVTDVYVPSLLLRNLPTPNWGALAGGDESIEFYNELILELLLNSGTLTASEVQLQSVGVSIKNPATGDTIATQVFTKPTKEALDEFEWTGYYDDVNFCSYHNSNNTCDVWYKEGTDRVTSWAATNVIPDIADICQTGIDSTSRDYFSFDAENWFTSFDYPLLDININVVATVVLCDGSGSGRRLQSGGGDDEITTVEYITMSTVTTVKLDNTVAPTTTTVTDTNTNTNIIIMAATIPVGVMACACFCCFIAMTKKKKHKQRKGEEYYTF